MDGAALAGSDDQARAIRALLGESTPAGTSVEIAWAVPKLLERAAAPRPLVVVFDDVHWGEATFLDLVEQVADLSRGAPVFLLCMARPELLEHRPTWGGGKLNATTVLLEPLNSDEADELIDRLLPAGARTDPALRTRALEAAAGNPLFLEEIAAVVASSGGNVLVPPTIQALLAARLDQLDPAERWVLERGSVEGNSFHRGAVSARARPSPGNGPCGSPRTWEATGAPDRPRPASSKFSERSLYTFCHPKTSFIMANRTIPQSADGCPPILPPGGQPEGRHQ